MLLSFLTGQDRFRTLTQRYYESADAVLLVYSVTDEESFRDIEEYWLKELHHYLNYDGTNIPILLVANKSDLISPNTDTVNFQTSKELAKHKGFLSPIQCSAKTGDKVKQVFHVIATELYKRRQPPKKPKVSNVSDGGCCSSRTAGDSTTTKSTSTTTTTAGSSGTNAGNRLTVLDN
jgi:GTPase SAR1 family protein